MRLIIPFLLAVSAGASEYEWAVGLDIPDRSSLSLWRLQDNQAVGFEVYQATLSDSNVDQPAPDDVEGNRLLKLSGAVEIKRFLAGYKVRVFQYTRLLGRLENVRIHGSSHTVTKWTVRPSVGGGVAFQPFDYAGIWMSQGLHVSINRWRWGRSFDLGILYPRVVAFFLF